MAEEFDTLKFTLARKRQYVELTYPDGQLRRSVLIQFDGKGRDAYVTQNSKRFDKDGHITNWTGMTADILQFTLHDIKEKQGQVTETLWPLVDIQALPHDVQEKLARAAKNLCMVDEAEPTKDEVGNDSGASD